MVSLRLLVSIVFSADYEYRIVSLNLPVSGQLELAAKTNLDYELLPATVDGGRQRAVGQEGAGAGAAAQKV